MSERMFLVFMFVFFVIIGALQIALNRGKIKAGLLVLLLAVSTASAIPVSFFTAFPQNFSWMVYLPIIAVLGFPTIILTAWRTFRKRGPLGIGVALILGLLVMYATPCMPSRLLKIVFIVIGCTAMTVGMYQQYRHPVLNPMWLDDLLKEIAHNTPGGYRYSPKPVVIPGRFNGTYWTSTIGVHLVIKPDRLIVWMKKKEFEHFGRPNLTEFAERLAVRIGNKMEMNADEK